MSGYTIQASDNADSEQPDFPCPQKLAFGTQREANAVIHAIIFKYSTSMYSYHCQYCALWHLSSK